MSESPKASYPTPPFDTYDFLSLLIPAAAFLVSAYSFELAMSAATTNSLQNFPLHWLLDKSSPVSGDAVRQTGYIAVVLSFFYVMGHVISCTASLVLDRFFIYKAYGYPYEFLLLKTTAKQQSGQGVKTISRQFYRGTVFWVNGALLTEVILAAFYSRTIYPKWVTLMLIAVGVAYSVLRVVYKKDRFCRLFRSHKNAILRIAAIYAAPYNLCANYVENYTRTRETFPVAFQRQYFNLFEREFGSPALGARSNNYWFCRFYVTQRDERIARQIDHYRVIHTFSRNTSCALYLAYLFSACYVITLPHRVAPQERIVVGSLPCVFLFFSCLLAIRYYYYYVAYYSKCLYRAFVFLAYQESPVENRSSS